MSPGRDRTSCHIYKHNTRVRSYTHSLLVPYVFIWFNYSPSFFHRYPPLFYTLPENTHCLLLYLVLPLFKPLLTSYGLSPNVLFLHLFLPVLVFPQYFSNLQFRFSVTGTFTTSSSQCVSINTKDLYHPTSSLFSLSFL